MALCKRLIARLDIKGSRLIKGIRFEGLRVLGDPCEAALRYADAGADELLYVDAVASLYGRNGLAELLRTTSKKIFIPITAGGGVRSVDDATSLLAAGADKIAVNTAAVQRPKLITELAEAFGRQCVVVSIQARRTTSSSWEVMTESGRERSSKDVLAWIQEVQELGAGEILITSVDQDGTCAGPDIELNKFAAEKSTVPILVGGGFSKSGDITTSLTNNMIHGVALGAALHKDILNINSLKQESDACDKGFSIRKCAQNLTIYDKETKSLGGLRISILDYGMGNQQSLLNSFEALGAKVKITSDYTDLSDSSLIALPGVGAFGNGINRLKSRHLDSFIRDWVNNKRPLLGICLGMQLLFEESREFGLHKGLSLLKGNVEKLSGRDLNGQVIALPHVGWNRLIKKSNDLDKKDTEELDQYFVHSYAVKATEQDAITYHCQYGSDRFVAAVKKDSIAGFQFHPERSGKLGLKLMSDTCNSLIASAS